MVNSEILILGVALALDASIASFAYGLISVDLPKGHRILRALTIGFTFGFFQFSMLWLGSFFGYLFSFSPIGHLFDLIVAGSFFFLSLKCIQESFKKDEDDLKWGPLIIIMLAVATSLDSLAAGIGLGVLPKTYLIAADVGLITFLLTSAFFGISKFFKTIPDKWLLRFSGLVFFIFGGRIIWYYLPFGAL